MSRARENADGARLDAPLASPTFTGTATFSGDLVPSSPLSHRNMIINGGMQVFQRGIEETGVWGSAGAYLTVADRYKHVRNAGSETGRATVTRSTEVPATGRDLKVLDHC